MPHMRVGKGAPNEASQHGDAFAARRAHACGRAKQWWARRYPVAAHVARAAPRAFAHHTASARHFLPGLGRSALARPVASPWHLRQPIETPSNPCWHGACDGNARVAAARLWQGFRRAARNAVETTMGIFDALTTAVTGMQAQSYALQNISGNIANSQTTAYKRTETSFQDMVRDAPPTRQTAGAVAASSRATNNVQGDLQNSSVGTFMAVSGEGFFVVQKPSGFVDGRPSFDGINIYTRRGDFQTDKNGFLVNGAGYYLLGIPVDPTTGNLVGSVPQLLQFQNDFLPAQATTQIEYRANLPKFPKPDSLNSSIPGSELLNPAAFSANPIAGPPQAAKVTGFGANVQEVTAAVTGTGTFANPTVTQFGAGNGGLLRIVVNGTNYDVTINDTDA